MDWDVVNGFTGIVSAISAIVGLGYSAVPHKLDDKSELGLTRYLSTKKIMFFMVACSGWILCCLSYLWIVEPYGSYVSSDNYQQFYGILIAFPALIILFTGLRLLNGTESKDDE